MENKLFEVDKNMVGAAFEKDDFIFYNIKNEPFDVYGLYEYKDHVPFMRMPSEVAEQCCPGAKALYKCPSGGRVRFKTDSPCIAIKLETSYWSIGINQQVLGSACPDLYVNKKYIAGFMPPRADVSADGGYESIIELRDGRIREKLNDIIINMPLYNPVDELYIGIKKGYRLEKGNEYKYKKPVLFYGSSITQGGCSSHPGSCYPALISKYLDTDFINLGFSGGAHGEDPMVDYMTTLDVSMLVCDYDYNSVSAEAYRNTHEKLFKKMRAAKPELPVIFVTRPDFNNWDDIREAVERRNIAYTTYMNAVKSGDKNVYFIDGDSLFGGLGHDECTTDGCHPNDLGFWRMYEVIGRAVEMFLEK